jgi:mannose-1-phosphate guanylyltransferase
MRHLWPVIMAGGSGTRFWPASRARWPKQLLALSGERTLLQETRARVAPLAPPERTLVVTHADHAKAVRSQLPELPRGNVLPEAVARNTAACAALAAYTVAEQDPDGLLLLLPSDHEMQDPESWRGIILKGAADAQALDTVLTLGLVPTRPEIGYGYIKTGPLVKNARTPGLRKVAEFVEKPVLERAKRFVASGRYLWNSGVFLVRAGHLVELVREHLTDLARGLEGVFAKRASRRAAELARVYPTLPAVSLDVGIMEKATGLIVAPANVGWSDVGSWSALHEVLPEDAARNIGVGEALHVDSSGCVTYSTDGLIATVGVQDLVIVKTADAVLVCPKDRAQDVRKIVEELKKRGDHGLV